MKQNLWHQQIPFRKLAREAKANYENFNSFGFFFIPFTQDFNN